MKILFICTAHNSLSQRLYLALSQLHAVTIEYALSDESMREAARLAKPDLIICPFLTSRVPTDLYEEYLTLIVHPGPPGDAGPSSLDWVLMGDDGSEPDAAQLLSKKDTLSENGRPYWGVTVLQAEAELDAGPVWAYEQFPVNIDEQGLTKSGLYRGPVTRAAVSACLAAVDRINATAYTSAPITPPLTPGSSNCPSPVYRAIHPGLKAKPQYKELSVGLQKPFLGGTTHHRPLLKAGQRDFDVRAHTAREISRRVRCGDSQPGCQSSVFGQSMYIYGGVVDEGPWIATVNALPGAIIAVRDEAVCFKTADQRGIWITHVRRIKKKSDPKLWPKVPAVSGLRQLGLLKGDDAAVARLARPAAPQAWSRSAHGTFQEVWVDFVAVDEIGSSRVAYVYSDFYNGAMSTAQCGRLVEALGYVLSTHTPQHPLSAVVMMGGSGYFSNGIHLNVIESAADPAKESWDNINAINDVVYFLLHEFPCRNILTVAGIRGNAAAGGVALAAACDTVVAGADVVLNPAYRALGLYGSEYHSISYFARCGAAGGRRILRDMTPISAYDARSIGLVDHVLPGYGALLDTRIRNHVKAVVRSSAAGPSSSPGSSPGGSPASRGSSTGRGILRNRSSAPSLKKKTSTDATSLGSGACNGSGPRYAPGAWKRNADTTPQGLNVARARELGEMSLDFWSPRSERYHTRREAFVRKMKASSTPLRFAKHRRNGGVDDDTSAEGSNMSKLDEEETDEYDSVEYFARKQAGELEARVMARLVAQQQRQQDAAAKQEVGEIGVAVTGDAPAQPVNDQGPVFACYYNAESK
jgi:enoyl-CoA hydratase/carnithine racemase/methionyl-tRNA formyltransferase